MDIIDLQRLPSGGLELIRRLERAGYEAWFVGGCVRDLLLGDTPHDWDICTSARPEETERILVDCRIHETGILHGTVMVISDGAGYEITTFRAESGHSDHRRPDRVEFVRSLTSDLSRRDLTINAMAYHPERGLADPFGGREDLEQGLIRAVGDPVRRMEEDALRILRALRFAGRFGFRVEEETARAMLLRREDLNSIAPERVFSELKGILCAQGAAKLLLDFRAVFAVVLPELVPLFDYDQDTPHHDVDAWRHTARVVDEVGEEPVLRLAALFHDAGKPDCHTRDAAGASHFYGHPRRSAAIAVQALRRLRCDRATLEQVERLVRLHDASLPRDLPAIRRFISRYGIAFTRQLLQLRRADVLGQSAFQREEKLARLDEFEGLLDVACAEEPCFNVSQLAIDGEDLISLGVAPGPGMGRILRRTLEAVLDGETINEKVALLDWLREHGSLR